MATAPEVDRTLRDAVDRGLRTLELDLGDVSFLDSSGVRLLVVWAESARRDGHDLRLRLGRQPAVREVLELTGVLERLTLVHPEG